MSVPPKDYTNVDSAGNFTQGGTSRSGTSTTFGGYVSLRSAKLYGNKLNVAAESVFRNDKHRYNESTSLGLCGGSVNIYGMGIDRRERGKRSKYCHRMVRYGPLCHVHSVINRGVKLTAVNGVYSLRAAIDLGPNRTIDYLDNPVKMYETTRRNMPDLMYKIKLDDEYAYDIGDTRSCFIRYAEGSNSGKPVNCKLYLDIHNPERIVYRIITTGEIKAGESLVFDVEDTKGVASVKKVVDSNAVTDSGIMPVMGSTGQSAPMPTVTVSAQSLLDEEDEELLAEGTVDNFLNMFTK